jgi:hypothetical protein
MFLSCALAAISCSHLFQATLDTLLPNATMLFAETRAVRCWVWHKFAPLPPIIPISKQWSQASQYFVNPGNQGPKGITLRISRSYKFIKASKMHWLLVTFRSLLLPTPQSTAYLVDVKPISYNIFLLRKIKLRIEANMAMPVVVNVGFRNNRQTDKQNNNCWRTCHSVTF